VRVELDAGRIEQLRAMADDELPAILTETAHDLDALIGETAAALAAGDFKRLFQAAHSGRNLAMLVGARELGGAYAAVAKAALDGDRGVAAQAVEQARAAWPATRLAIESLPTGEAG
jgi:hypothetical protein